MSQKTELERDMEEALSRYIRLCEQRSQQNLRDTYAQHQAFLAGEPYTASKTTFKHKAIDAAFDEYMALCKRYKIAVLGKEEK